MPARSRSCRAGPRRSRSRARISVAQRDARSGCSRRRTSPSSTHTATAAAPSIPSTGASSNGLPTRWPMPRQPSSARPHARSARCPRSTSDSSATTDAPAPSRRPGHVFVAPHAAPWWSSGCSSSSPVASRSRPAPPPRTSTRTARRMEHCSTATRSRRSHSPPATSTPTGVSTASRSSRSTRATRSSSRPGGSRTGPTRSSSARTAACSARPRRDSASSSTQPRRRSPWTGPAVVGRGAPLRLAGTLEPRATLLAGANSQCPWPATAASSSGSRRRHAASF